MKNANCSEIGINDEKSFEFLSHILDNIHESFLILDDNLTIKHFNKAAENATGLKSSLILNKYFFDVFDGAKGSIIEEKFNWVLENRKEVTLETFYDKEPFKNWYEIRIYPHGYDIAVFLNTITRRKLAEQSKAESEQWNQILLENAGVGIGYYDIDGKILMFNKLAAEHLNGSPEDFMGKYVHEIFTPNMASLIMERIENAIKSDKKLEFEDFFNAPSGQKWFLSNFVSIKDFKGNVMGVQIISQDITLRKLFEDELIKSEEKYRDLYKSMNEGLAVHKIIYDIHGQAIDYFIIEVNPAYEKLLGLKKEDVIGRKASEVYGTNKPPYIDIYSLVVETRSPEHFETYFEPMNRYFSISVFSPKIGEFVTVFEDITSRIKSEKELRESEEKLRLAIESANLGTWYWEVEKDNMVWSDRCKEIFGIKIDQEPSYELFMDFLHPGDREKIIEIMKSAVENNYANAEHRVIWPDGSVHWVQSTGKLYSGEKGLKAFGIVIDIDDRKNSEINIRKSEEKYRNLFETMAQGVVYQDFNGQITSANPAAEDILGLSFLQMQGRTSNDHVWKSIHEDGSDFPGDTHPSIKALKSGQKVKDVVMGVLNPKKEGYTWININATPLFRNDQDLPYQVYTIFEDITERKNYEKALKLSEKKFRTAFENSTMGMSINDIDGNFIDVNDAFCHMLGYSRSELLSPSLNYLSITYADDEATSKKYVNNLLNGKKSFYNFQKRYLHRDGSIIWAYLTLFLIKDDENNPLHFITHIQNITAWKKAQDEIINQNKLLELAHVFVVDNDDRIIFWNKGSEKLYGWSPEEALGRKSYEILKTKFPKPLADIKLELNRFGHWEGELIHKCKNGKSLTVASHWVSQFNDSGDNIATLEVNNDITKRKIAEENLKETLEELRKSNAELEQFAYVASHDLQEPLRMITSFLQLLSQRYEGKLDSDADEFIGFAVDGASRMQELINDLLIYSRVSRKAKKFENINTESTLIQAIFNLKVYLEEKNANITYDNLPVVYGDYNQFIQLFQNFIANSIKYSINDPVIHICAEKKDEYWIFQIKDNGIGIDPKHHDRIFRIFQRLHRSGEYDGTGIGLAICKRIIERHGGDIWVDSKLGNGAIFYFKIPIREDEIRGDKFD